jgi:hypothetical protein
MGSCAGLKHPSFTPPHRTPPQIPKPNQNSVLKRITFKRPCDNFVLLHLQRRHLAEWVRAMVAVALGVGPRRPLPPILLQEPTDNRFAQMSEWLWGAVAGRFGLESEGRCSSS